MADKQKPEVEQRVLRVNQLDATLLDAEIVTVLRGQLTKAFKFFSAGLLSKIQPELNAALRALVWRYLNPALKNRAKLCLGTPYYNPEESCILKLQVLIAFSIYSKGSTIGQQMLNMKYSESMSYIQKIVFGFAIVGSKYLQDRSTEIKNITRKYGDFTLFWRFVQVTEKIAKVASLINFFIFLQNGRFQSLLERLLGLHHVFEQRQSVRQVSFEFMTRELLWHGFAEFLFFLLPLINVRKIKNLLVQQFMQPTLSSQPGVTAAYHECGICRGSPTAPHQGACNHVFCYYCIKGNSLADSSFPCPLCGNPVGENIHPVECTVALQIK